MQNTVQQALLSLEEKKTLVKELWDYHDTTVQNDCTAYYSETFDIGHRTFKEQLSGRRTMKGSQVQFVIDFLIERTSSRGVREIFARLFQAQPEAYGYLMGDDSPLPFDRKPTPAV